MRLPAWEVRRLDGTVLVKWFGDETVFDWGPEPPLGRATVFRNGEPVYELLDGRLMT